MYLHVFACNDYFNLPWQFIYEKIHYGNAYDTVETARRICHARYSKRVVWYVLPFINIDAKICETTLVRIWPDEIGETIELKTHILVCGRFLVKFYNITHAVVRHILKPKHRLLIICCVCMFYYLRIFLNRCVFFKMKFSFLEMPSLIFTITMTGLKIITMLS